MLKKFCREKYKNDLTTHVGEFLESLLGDNGFSGINPAAVSNVSHSGSGLNDAVAVAVGASEPINLHKV